MIMDKEKLPKKLRSGKWKFQGFVRIRFKEKRDVDYIEGEELKELVKKGLAIVEPISIKSKW